MVDRCAEADTESLPLDDLLLVCGLIGPALPIGEFQGEGRLTKNRQKKI